MVTETPYSEQHPDADRISAAAHQVVKRRLTVPAILWLESTKPIATVQGSLLTVLGPALQGLFDVPGYDRWARILGDRDDIEALLVAIEDEAARHDHAHAKVESTADNADARSTA